MPTMEQLDEQIRATKSRILSIQDPDKPAEEQQQPAPIEQSPVAQQPLQQQPSATEIDNKIADVKSRIRGIQTQAPQEQPQEQQVQPEQPEYNAVDSIRQIRTLNQDIYNASQRRAEPTDRKMTPMGYLPTRAKMNPQTQNEILLYEEQVRNLTDELEANGVPKSVVADTLEVLKSVEPYGQGEVAVKQGAAATVGGIVGGSINPLLALPGAAIAGAVANLWGQATNPDQPAVDWLEAGKQGALEGTFEGVGRYGIPAVKYLGKLVKKTSAYPIKNAFGLTEPERDLRLIDKALRQAGEAIGQNSGITLASKNPDKKMVRFIQELAQSAIGGDTMFKNLDVANQKAIIGYMNGIIDQTATYDNAGQMILNQYWRGGRGMPKGLKVDQINEVTGKMYDEVSDLTGLVSKGVDDLGNPVMDSKANVYIGDLRKWATEELAVHRNAISKNLGGTLDNQTVNLLEEIEGLGKSNEMAKAMEKHGELISGLSPEDKTRFLDQMGIKSTDTDMAPLEIMRKKRTKFMNQGKSLQHQTSVAQGTHDTAINKINEAFGHTKTLDNMPPAAAEKLKNANKTYATMNTMLDELYDKKMMDTMSSSPHKFVDELLPSKGKTKIENVRNSLIKNVDGGIDVEGTIAWDKLRHAKLGEFIKQATHFDIEKGIDVIDFKQLNDSLKSFGDDAMRELLKSSSSASGVEYRRFQKGLKMLRHSQETGGRPYAIITGGKQITQAAAVAGMVPMILYGGKDGLDTGDYLGLTALGALAIGPTYLAKLMTTPAGMDILEGTTKTSFKKGGAAVQMGIRALRARQKMDKKDADAEQRADAQFARQMKMEKRREARDRLQREYKTKTGKYQHKETSPYYNKKGI